MRRRAPRGAGTRLLAATGSCAVLAVCLSACGAAGAAGAAPRATVTVTVPGPALAPSGRLPADDAPLDLRAVCAAESMIRTAERYREDAGGPLTDAQGDAILGSITAQYEELRIGARDTTARAPLTAITAYLQRLHLKPGGPSFDPDASAIAEPEGRISELCSENGTPVTISATVGG